MALPFQLLEVVNDSMVHLLYPVHNHKNGNRVGIDTIDDQLPHVVLDALDAVLEHGLILAVHADTDSQL